MNVDATALEAVASRFPGCVVAADWAVDTALPTALVRPAPHRPLGHTENPAPSEHHLAAVVFTSGSTGTPVAHEKRWGALVDRTRSGAEAFGLTGGTIVGTVPPQHMYGFETTVLMPLHAPVASWCGPVFYPADIEAALRACPGPRVLVTTPLQLRALVQGRPALAIDACISATAPLEPTLAAEAESAWGAPVLEIFGATECGSIAHRRTTAGPLWTCYPRVKLAIDDDGTVVRAPHADPVALADVLEPAHGGFRLLGRRTDVVKLAGRRASLAGLNRALTGVDGVDDGAFVVPDDTGSEGAARLVAIVVAPARATPAILADLRRVIDPVFLPRRVIRVDAMPRDTLGKLPRQALLDLLARSDAA